MGRELKNVLALLFYGAGGGDGDAVKGAVCLGSSLDSRLGRS